MSDSLATLYPDDTVIAHGVWHGMQDPRVTHGPQQFLWTWQIVGPGDRRLVTDSAPAGVPYGVVRG